MRQVVNIALFTLFVFLLMYGCYYDSEEFLYPQISSQCDTINVSYSLSVVPVLQSNCISCHSSSLPSGNINLSDYTQVFNSATTKRNNTSILLGVINHDNGFSPMPQPPSPKLDDCSIQKIKKWIDAGAHND